jgi:hypothetical protein
MMPELAQAPRQDDGETAADDDAASPPAAVEQPSAQQVVPGTPGEEAPVSLRAAAYDVPVAMLQALADAARRYGAQLVALVILVVISRFLLGIPSVLGGGVGVGTWFVRWLTLKGGG